MKVSYVDSFRYKMLNRIASMPDNVVVRADVTDLGSPRQVSRAFKLLVKEGYLVRLGYGVYAKLRNSKFTGGSYLDGGFLSVVREALSKLNVMWEPSSEEQNYNAGRSTQVPVSPYTKLKTRFRRKLKYRSKEFKIG